MADPGRAIDKVIKREGGLSDVKQDRGGRTKYGITRPVLDEAIRRGLVAPTTTIDSLTVAEAALIYLELFWKPMRLGEVNSQAIAGELLDTGVNCGPGTAVKILQRAMQLWDRTIKADGIIGPRTLGCLNQLSRDRKIEILIYRLLNIMQGDRYIDLAYNDPEQMTFLRGWIDKRISLDPGEEEK